MTRTIELTLEKECDLKPGPCNVVKVDGKKLTVEVSEESNGNSALGACADKKEILGKIMADAVRDSERPPRKKRKMSEILAGYSGKAFKDAQEVDDFLRAERESWDK